MRFSILFLLLLVISAASAQEPFVRRGLLRAQATISPARFTDLSSGSVYIHGDLEYYFEEKISVRGDSYYFLSHTSGPKYFAHNHSSFAGIAYHFSSEKKFDPYISFQPGVAYSKDLLLRPLGTAPDHVFSPLISTSMGFNFYATKYFHLLGGVRYVHGKYLGDPYVLKLNEVRFSFGLGWNIRIKKYEQRLKTETEFKG